MTTTNLFSERLLKIFEDFSLTSTQFADQIGVQKSTLSHLLSNRNKPSLDLLLKIIEHFPTLNLYWLADGSLPIYRSSKSDKLQEADFITQKIPSTESEFYSKESKNIGESIVKEESPNFSENLLSAFSHSSEIDYIVVLYKDGSFKRYKEL